MTKNFDDILSMVKSCSKKKVSVLLLRMKMYLKQLRLLRSVVSLIQSS